MSSKQIISRRTPSLALLQALPSPLARLIEWIAASWSSGAASRSILPFIPKPVKWFFLIVLLFNARSWPGVWHARVFRSVFRIRLHALLYKRGDGREWWTDVSPVGRSVFPTPNGLDKGARSVLKSWAAPDDCDWNGHLSNSCYAKNLDPARMQACIDWFPAFFGDGGWVALGGAHYHYIREIPINAAYEVRMSIGGWEDKWIYLVTKFVTLPKKKSKSTPHKAHGTTASAIPSITTPSTPSLIESSTPAEPATTTNSGQPLDASWVDTKLTPISAPKPTLRTHDDDGALIHCIAVSTYCFKHGRLTVPPKIALAMCGYSSGEVGDRSNWSHAARIRDRGTARIPEFYRGGWKNEENKFWEPSPKVEAERVRRVADLKKLTEGLDGLRAY